MTDRPIIFSAPMILALLDGRKSQTRRPFSRRWCVLGTSWAGKKFAPLWAGFGWEWSNARNWPGDPHIAVPWWHPEDGPVDPDESGIYRIRPPYAPGDRLWVREALRFDAEWDDCPPKEFDSADAIHYEADGARDTSLWGDPFRPGRLRSPIHMPRWASRLTLVVSDVRVHRLQEISEADALAEGCIHHHDPSGDGQNIIEQFAYLWNSIHGSDAWDANPWVAAITFSTHRCNIDRMEAE